MTPRELIPLLDSGMVEELTMYYNGRKTIIDIRNVPKCLPDFQISKMWNSESGKGISVLLTDNVVNSNELHISLSEEGADRIKEILHREGLNNAR
jgi:hypothetical protein